MTPQQPALDTIGRRRFLVLGGMTVIAAACSPGSPDSAPTTTTPAGAAEPTSANTTSADTTTAAGSTVTAESATTSATTAVSSEGPLVAFTAADFEALGVCTLLAETTAGPFPTLTELERSDVTEGYPGHPVRLGLRVIDSACQPVPGAVVEIWHSDASGDYSEYTDGGGGKDEAEGSTFLRGHQIADADGIVEFHTIYPGWYPGRAVHIHLRVALDDDELLTSQLFFDDAYTEQVYREAPYAEFGSPDTPTATDGIAGPAIATGGLLTLVAGPTAAGSGTVARTNLGVST